jgi:pterin-4a-carbinolamine dehydratase
VVSAKQFQEADGTADWRALARGASALFRTGGAREGAAFVERVAAVADGMDHHPDLDLRRDGVVARVFTHSDWAITEKDLELARAISAAAAELGLAPDPRALQEIDLTIDAMDIAAVRPFWAAVLGHDLVGDENLLDPHWRWPAVWFQQMDAPRPLRNRMHVDTFVPRGQRSVRVDAALAAGGHVANDAFAPNWWTLADAEGNEADVNDWEGFPYDIKSPWLSPADFAASGGVEDWAFLQGASSHYRTKPGLGQAAALAAKAAALADDVGLPIYADLRWGGVTFRVEPPEDGWMDDRGLALCRGIQLAARDLGPTADPLAVRDMHVVIDALDIPALQTFWAAVLGYSRRGDEDLYDPLMRGPAIVFQQMDEPREQRNRIHLDAVVPDDVATQRIDAALAAGGHLVSDAHAPFWWTLADPEGNEVDVAVSVGRAEAWG